MSNIIFLDFDGVVRIANKKANGIEAEFCLERLSLVEKLAIECNAKVVISSDWRESNTHEGICDILSGGIKAPIFHDDWSTPVMRFTKSGIIIPRGVEILTWLYRNKNTNKFIILDD